MDLIEETFLVAAPEPVPAAERADVTRENSGATRRPAEDRSVAGRAPVRAAL